MGYWLKKIIRYRIYVAYSCRTCRLYCSFRSRKIPRQLIHSHFNREPAGILRRSTQILGGRVANWISLGLHSLGLCLWIDMQRLCCHSLEFKKNQLLKFLMHFRQLKLLPTLIPSLYQIFNHRKGIILLYSEFATDQLGAEMLCIVIIGRC